MKIVLILFMCSYVTNTCLPPHQFSENFDDMYSCMIAGYEKSQKKMKELGKEEVNNYKIYIKFLCAQKEETNT